MLMTSLLGVEMGGLPDGEAQSVALVQQKLRGNLSGKRSAALDSQQVGCGGKLLINKIKKVLLIIQLHIQA